MTYEQWGATGGAYTPVIGCISLTLTLITGFKCGLRTGTKH
ncbi:hypothetical protein [Vibrio sp. McD22-P3]|nr:hypothetical protein [Vibrio sp. McD22-P3]